MTDGSRRVLLAALSANVGIAVAKFVGFVFTGSASMLAEAVHSVADSGNQVLLFIGGIRARRAPTREHPFGYGRERYFWAFVVSMVLFTLGSLFALHEGLQKLQHPHALESPLWAVGILVFAIAVEGLAMRTAAREASRLRDGQPWWAYIRHSKSPEIPVLLLEDTGAVIGLTFALAGVGLSVVTGDARFDAGGSIAIGLLLGVIAFVLATEMKSLLIGESARPAEGRRIREAILGTPHVRLIHDLRTLHLGPDQILVAAKVELDEELTFAEVAGALNQAEARVLSEVPAARWMYLEPDVSGSAVPQADPSPSEDG
jgi:cation diffusion facilitator family transporter